MCNFYKKKCTQDKLDAAKYFENNDKPQYENAVILYEKARRKHLVPSKKNIPNLTIFSNIIITGRLLRQGLGPRHRHQPARGFAVNLKEDREHHGSHTSNKV